jgi:hypothetical protein
MTPEELARAFHETYERLAPEHGYKTRPESAVPWESVPDQNKKLMIHVAAEIQTLQRTRDLSESRGISLHVLKCWPEPFVALMRGDKTYEIRVNDRNYGVGDILELTEWIPAAEVFTGRKCWAKVMYMTNGGEWGLPEALCVMSIRLIRRT